VSAECSVQRSFTTQADSGCCDSRLITDRRECLTENPARTVQRVKEILHKNG
jgi:hypothetical protein